MTGQNLSSRERLKNKFLFEQVFRRGKSVNASPIRMIYLFVPGERQTKAGFAVSARLFPKAHDRNRIKRLMRESYRLSKPFEVGNKSGGYHVVFVYSGRKEEGFHAIQEKFNVLLDQLQKEPGFDSKGI